MGQRRARERLDRAAPRVERGRTVHGEVGGGLQGAAVEAKAACRIAKVGVAGHGEHARVQARAAPVAVVGGQEGGAGAGLNQPARAADRVAERQRVGAVDGQRAADVDRPRDRADGAAVAELQRAVRGNGRACRREVLVDDPGSTPLPEQPAGEADVLGDGVGKKLPACSIQRQAGCRTAAHVQPALQRRAREQRRVDSGGRIGRVEHRVSDQGALVDKHRTAEFESDGRSSASRDDRRTNVVHEGATGSQDDALRS
jgi:hypothetical protein